MKEYLAKVVWTAKEGKEKSRDNGDRAASNHPEGTIGGVAGEEAGNVGAERLRFVKAENQEHDSQRQNCETDNAVHDCPFNCFNFASSRKINIGDFPSPIWIVEGDVSGVNESGSA